MSKIRLFMLAAMVPLILWPYFVELPGSDSEAAGSAIDEVIGTHPFDRLMTAVFGAQTGDKLGMHGVDLGGESEGDISAFAYSLWGSKIRYTWGMVAAAKLAPTVFPGWKVYIYHDHTVPGEILTELSDMTHVRLVDVEKDLPEWVHRDLNPMSWRFLIASDPTVAIYAIRDGDSRPTVREKAAVDEWLQSGKSFHIMRDHPMHNPVKFAPILGGMWGGLHRAVPHMDKLLKEYYGTAKKIRYAEDQNFLWQNILPLAAKDCMQHDSYYCGESGALAFPMTRLEADAPYTFVGQAYKFDEGDERADPRLSLPESLGRYEACLFTRGMKIDKLRAMNATAIPSTPYKGKVTGSSTESWDQWRAGMGKQVNPQPVVKGSTKLTKPQPPKQKLEEASGGGKHRVVTIKRGQDAVVVRAGMKQKTDGQS